MRRIQHFDPHTWAIVLAGGAGTRLRELTTDARGTAVPKQYCSLRGGRSLLADALERAARVATEARTLVVVTEEHAAWWKPELAKLSRENVLVQPFGRGTAAGILLPALTLYQRDRHARVAVMPSDHFVREEWVLERALRGAFDAVARDPRSVLLLGITPDAAEPDYGWIVPELDARPVKRVARFVEKPAPELAESLRRQGGVWNSFLFAARVDALLGLFATRTPALLDSFRATLTAGAARADLETLYAGLSELDFSRAVLQGSEPALRLQTVPECGWTDLGTPARVRECLDWCARTNGNASASAVAPAVLDLARALQARARTA
jgi:mannose-1-phosphate guanylyltransferase